MEIFAKIESHALLKNGIIPVIGSVSECKRYKWDGSCESQIRIEFVFDKKNSSDIFLFENNTLVFHSISINTDTFITELYKELLEIEIIAPNQFIDKITEGYVLNELCF